MMTTTMNHASATTVLNRLRPRLYSPGSMADSSSPPKEHVSIPSWAIAILVSIVVAGIGNIAAMSAWKGALDSKLGSIESQLARIENLPGRVSVLEARREADEREWRGRGEDISRRLNGLEDQFRDMARQQSVIQSSLRISPPR